MITSSTPVLTTPTIPTRIMTSTRLDTHGENTETHFASVIHPLSSICTLSFLCSAEIEGGKSSEDSVVPEAIIHAANIMKSFTFEAIFTSCKNSAMHSLSKVAEAAGKEREWEPTDIHKELDVKGDSKKKREAMDTLIRNIRGNKRYHGAQVLLVGDVEMGRMFQAKFLDTIQHIISRKLPKPYDIITREFSI